MVTAKSVTGKIRRKLEVSFPGKRDKSAVSTHSMEHSGEVKLSEPAMEVSSGICFTKQRYVKSTGCKRAPRVRQPLDKLFTARKQYGI